MRILIIDDMHPLVMEKLEAAGHEVLYRPEIAAKEVAQSLKGIDGLIVRSKVFVDSEMITHADQLKFIARAGAGTDNLDEEALASKGIEIINAPEGNRDAVGDHTVGLILALTNRIVKGNAEIKNLIWDREGNRGVELNELTIGIYGFGNTGQAVARRLLAFGCKLIFFDLYHPEQKIEGVESVKKDELIKRSDILTFHIPLTQETKSLINSDFLSKVKKGAYLINTSRGGIMDYTAVADMLEQGYLTGVGLDVLENEKLSTLTQGEKLTVERLISNHMCIITPHVAGWTVASYKRISEVIAQKILARY